MSKNTSKITSKNIYDRFKYFNYEIVNKINTIGVGNIQSYKNNLILNLDTSHIPDYYFSGYIPKSEYITRLTPKTLVKIF